MKRQMKLNPQKVIGYISLALTAIEIIERIYIYHARVKAIANKRHKTFGFQPPTQKPKKYSWYRVGDNDTGPK